MAKVTSKYVILPWLKGLDTDTDEGIMQFISDGRKSKVDFLRQAENIVFELDGSKNKRPGFEYLDSSAITNTPRIMAGFDYWCTLSNVKTQKIVAWDNQATSKCWFYNPQTGERTELTKDATATAPTNLKGVCFEVFNNDLIMALHDDQTAGRTPVKWDNQTGTAYVPLGGTPPKFRIIRSHQGRLWGVSPDNPDRLHFSSPGNHEEWNGLGDSGAIDIFPGDGDVSGITAIFPSFRGVLFVAKGSAIFRITGTDPLTYKVEMVTSGLGCVSHNSAVAVDMDDIYFASERGFHSLVLTEKYGDFEGNFLSSTVQNEYRDLDTTMLKFIQGVWIPSLNSIVWCVSENGTLMDKMWLYDVRFKAWYHWTGVNPTALFRVEDYTTKIKRAYFGNNAGRISKTQKIGTFNDYGSTAITQTIKTPFIYPDEDPASIKGLKKIGVWMKMSDGDALTVSVRLAGVTEEQELEFTSTSSGTASLDVDFILGESVLGASASLRMTPYTLPIDGYTTSCQLTFTQASLNVYCNIFGFWIEYERAGDSQETRGG